MYEEKKKKEAEAMKYWDEHKKQEQVRKWKREGSER